jgi:hypothetical protein
MPRPAGFALYVVESLSPRASHPASRSHTFHLCEPTVTIPPPDLSMLSIISHPHTTLLCAFLTSARIPRLATHGLYLTSGTAYSARSSCGMRAVRPSSLALHFSPHTRPPDIAARLEYQGSLVNTYSSLDLRSIPRHRLTPSVLLPSPEAAPASTCLAFVAP